MSIKRRETQGNQQENKEENKTLLSGLSDNKSKNNSFKDEILEKDVLLTNQLAVCATKDSSYGSLRPLMKLLEISGHGVPWIFCTVMALLMSKNKLVLEKMLNMLIGLILDLVVVGTVKAFVRRPRPKQNKMDMFATISVDKYAFPSGHTTRAAMMAFFLLIHFPGGPLRTTGIVAWALMVACSRVLLGRHHVLDVVCGIMIGLVDYKVLELMWLPADTCQHILQPIQEELHL